jgi:hypothetical protein
MPSISSQNVLEVLYYVQDPLGVRQSPSPCLSPVFASHNGALEAILCSRVATRRMQKQVDKLKYEGYIVDTKTYECTHTDRDTVTHTHTNTRTHSYTRADKSDTHTADSKSKPWKECFKG